MKQPQAELGSHSHPPLHRDLSRWGRLWGIPNLSTQLHVVFSRRLRATLARCRPAEAKIVLRDDLECAPKQRLAEVLCHEAAHVATHMLHGREAKPHGPEWQRLVRLAGFKPTVRAPQRRLSKRLQRRKTCRIYEHRCAVCQMLRIARRPVPTWRCSECLQAGLDGLLTITCLE